MSLLEAQACFQKAHVVLCYASMAEEVDTIKLMTKWSHTKQFLLPVVKGDNLVIKELDAIEAMQSSSFGILEPTGKEFQDFQTIDLILIPGLAFDKNGGRIGFGRGFYDRLLKNPTLVNVPKWGLAFKAQIVEAVPMEPHDVMLDAVLAPDIIYFNTTKT